MRSEAFSKTTIRTVNRFFTEICNYEKLQNINVAI